MCPSSSDKHQKPPSHPRQTQNTLLKRYQTNIGVLKQRAFRAKIHDDTKRNSSEWPTILETTPDRHFLCLGKALCGRWLLGRGMSAASPIQPFLIMCFVIVLLSRKKKWEVTNTAFYRKAYMETTTVGQAIYILALVLGKTRSQR